MIQLGFLNKPNTSHHGHLLVTKWRESAYSSALLLRHSTLVGDSWILMFRIYCIFGILCVCALYTLFIAIDYPFIYSTV